MIEDNRQLFLRKASVIDNWETENKNTLAKQYLINRDTSMGEAYLSAIILRYWSNIYRYHDKNPYFDLEDYLDFLIEAIQRAFDYCYNQGDIAKDPNGPDKAINRSIKNVILNHYYLSGMDKRSVNFNTNSLDTIISDDFNESWGNSIIVEDTNAVDSCRVLVQQYVNNHNLMDAIIIDNLCFQDSIKQGKFNMRRLVDGLININSNYVDYFINTYDGVNKDQIFKVALDIKKLSSCNNYNNTKLYKYIKKLLTSLKNNKEVLELLCC